MKQILKKQLISTQEEIRSKEEHIIRLSNALNKVKDQDFKVKKNMISRGVNA